MYFVVKEEKGYVEFASCSLYIRLTSWRFGMSSHHTLVPAELINVIEVA